ncbi:MAG: T9SS type A sorting domain-containing protein, partial [Fibrobacter sp.]|nr:T9SS type A sorting domain-containing protein [Fibrobacter sp.]
KFTGSGTSLFNFNWWRFKSDKVGTIADINRAACNSVKIAADKRVISVSFGSLPFSNKTMTVDVYNMSGRLIMSKATMFQSDMKLNSEMVQAGMYIVKVSYDKFSIMQTVNIQ